MSDLKEPISEPPPDETGNPADGGTPEEPTQKESPEASGDVCESKTSTKESLVNNSATNIKENQGVAGDQTTNVSMIFNGGSGADADKLLEKTLGHSNALPGVDPYDFTSKIFLEKTRKYQIPFDEKDALIQSRIAVMESLNERVLLDASLSVASKLDAQGYQCLEVDIGVGDERLDNVFQVRSFLNQDSENQVALFFHIHNSIVSGMAKSALSTGVVNLVGRLEQKKCVFVFLLYPGFSKVASESRLEEAQIFHWELDALDILIRERLPDEDCVALRDKLEAQRKKQLWPQDPTDFYSSVQRLLLNSSEMSLLQSIEEKEKEAADGSRLSLHVEPKTKGLLRKPCHQAVLFTVTFLPGLPPTSFRKVVNLLLDGRKYTVSKPKRIINESGQTEESEVQESHDALEYLDEHYETIWEECGIGLFLNDRDSFVVDFEDALERERLRRHLLTQPISFDGFSKIYNRRLMFDPELPERSVGHLVNYFASMFPKFSDDRDRGWLIELVEFARRLEMLLKKMGASELEKADASDINAVAKWFQANLESRNLTSFLIARITELCRSVIKQTSAKDINQLLRRLIESDDADIALQIGTRLRHEADFEILDLISQVIQQGRGGHARYLGLDALLKEASQSTERCIKVIETVEGWRADDDEGPRWHYATAFVPVVSRQLASRLGNRKMEQGGVQNLCQYSEGFLPRLVEGFTNEALEDSLTFLARDELKTWMKRGLALPSLEPNISIPNFLADSLAIIAETEQSESPFFEVVKDIVSPLSSRGQHEVMKIWRRHYVEREKYLRRKRQSLSSRKRQNIERAMQALVLLNQAVKA